MKKIYIITLVLVLSFSFFLGKKVLAQSPDQIQFLQQEIQRIGKLVSALRSIKEITAQSYSVINLFDNSVLLEKNKEKQSIPASTIKLMTAVITLENIDLNQTITLTQEMLSPLGWSPALYLGLNISAQNLLKASLIQSVNDASFSLTFFLPKNDFLNLMTQKAKDLDMKDTVFFDSNGLSPTNKTSAQDMAKLLSYIYQSHPEILEITRNNDFWLPGPDGKLLKFKNVNNLYQFPEFVGGKTGYLKKAGETFASIFILDSGNERIKNKPIAIVLFSSKNRQADVIKILNWLKINPSL